jgi:hypothetical protein
MHCASRVWSADVSSVPAPSMLKTYVEQVAIEYRCGHFEPETVDTMVWLHESRHNGVGERTAVAPGSARRPQSCPALGTSVLGICTEADPSTCVRAVRAALHAWSRRMRPARCSRLTGA